MIVYKRDLEVEADAIIDWAKKEDSLNLNGFCCERQFPANYLSVFCKKCEKFNFAFGVALCYLAVRRELMVSRGDLYAGAWMRNASVYDRLLRECERNQKEFDSQLRREEKETEAINLSDLVDRLTKDAD